MKARLCPKCNKTYKEYSAISRIDNKTKICPNCGLTEAIENFIKYNSIKKNKRHVVKLVS